MLSIKYFTQKPEHRPTLPRVASLKCLAPPPVGGVVLVFSRSIGPGGKLKKQADFAYFNGLRMLLWAEVEVFEFLTIKCGTVLKL